MPGDAFFLDSAYPIALASPGDQHHISAVDLAKELKAVSARLITTRAVLLEIGNALAKHHLRSVGVAILRDFESEPDVKIISLDDALYQRGLDLFQARIDKAWSLTDCISFVVMRDFGLSKALTSDQHFEQAGFTALLRK